MTVVTHGAVETQALAAAVGALLRPGDVVVLSGDLGAGKTTFVKGAARALGVEEPVTSPTFTIVQEYDGDVPVAHVDVYRLERLQELHDLGFEELLDRHVVFVEWGDAVAPVLPADRLEVRIGLDAGDADARTVAIAAVGAAWDDRRAALGAALTRAGAGG